MRLEWVTPVSEAQILSGPYHLTVAASGFEARATFLASRLDPDKSHCRIALGFDDRRVLHRDHNDQLFAERGFELLVVPGDSETAVWDLVLERIQDGSEGAFRVLVDYSCMTRVWYAGLLAALSTASADRPVEVVFSYSPAKFTPPQPPTPNAVMGPIPGFAGLGDPARNTALVVGLGYELHRAIGLVRYVDPAATYAFVADPALDDRYTSAAFKASRPLVERLGHERLVRYPLMDLRMAAAMLSSVCLGLREDHRVIVAPLGPKPFTLLSLLLATKYQGIDVWRVSSGTFGAPYDREPFGRLLGCSAFFKTGPRLSD